MNSLAEHNLHPVPTSRAVKSLRPAPGGPPARSVPARGWQGSPALQLPCIPLGQGTSEHLGAPQPASSHSLMHHPAHLSSPGTQQICAEPVGHPLSSGRVTAPDHGLQFPSQRCAGAILVRNEKLAMQDKAFLILDKDLTLMPAAGSSASHPAAGMGEPRPPRAAGSAAPALGAAPPSFSPDPKSAVLGFPRGKRL